MRASGLGRAALLLAPALLFLSGCSSDSRNLPVEPLPGKMEGFTAEYRISWTEGGADRKARLVAVFSPPHRLRLELLDPLGASRAVLVATRQGALLVLPSRREYRRYAYGREALKALCGMDLDPVLLAALLLGNPALAGEMSCAPGEGPDPSRLSCEGPGGDPAIRISGRGERWEVLRGGSAFLLAEMEVPERPRPSPPLRIRLREAAGEARVELRLREFRFAPPPEDLFLLQPPPSFRESPLEAPRPWDG